MDSNRIQVLAVVGLFDFVSVSLEAVPLVLLPRFNSLGHFSVVFFN